MQDFYKIVTKECNTEKSQKCMSSFNIRTFITLPSVRSSDIRSAFIRSFGYEPLKINSLTFVRLVNNKRSRTKKRVTMKKFLIALPKGKDLTSLNK